MQIYIYFMHTWHIYLFLNFFVISRLRGSSASIFQIVANLQKIFQYIYWKNLCISGQASSNPCCSRVSCISKPTIFFLRKWVYFLYYHLLFYLSVRKIVCSASTELSLVWWFQLIFLDSQKYSSRELQVTPKVKLLCLRLILGSRLSTIRFIDFNFPFFKAPALN